MTKSDKILHDALLKYNVLTEADLRIHIVNGNSLGENLQDFLLQNGVVTGKQVLIALSQLLKLDTVDFTKIEVDESVINKVPVKFVWYYKFMPIKADNNCLTIACSSYYDVRTVDEIRMHLGLSIEIVLAETKDLIEAIKKFYGFASHTIDKIISKEQISSQESSSDTGQWVEDIERQVEDPTVSGLVNQIILEAYKKRATDIHIEPYRDKVRFRYRIDGVLVDANLPNNVRHFLSPILSRIKILSNLSITEKRLPQDGSAVVKVKDQHLDLRISTMPTPRGESMVIRILPTKVMLYSLERLGVNQDSVNQFMSMINKPHGIIFMTGPTGSGKTTTLYACLNEINSSERKNNYN